MMAHCCRSKNKSKINKKENIKNKIESILAHYCQNDNLAPGF